MPASQFRAGADVVVIGAGVVGASLAYWLGRRGAEVVLLDTHLPGWGASGRNAGFLLAGASPLEDVGVLRAILGEEGIDAHYEQLGHLALASSEAVVARVRSEIAARPAGAPRLALVDRTECEQLVGHRISEQFLAGRWLASAGALHPVRLVRGLAAAAARRGVAIVPETEALRLAPRSGRVVVRTRRGSVTARRVVLACGAGSGHLAPALAPMFAPARGQMLATAPAAPLIRVGLAVDWGSVYCRQLRSGEILIGGLRGLDPSAECTTTDGLNPRIQSALATFLSDAFPGFDRPPVRWRWSGVMDETRDGRPLLGRVPGLDALWVAAGFGGHGLPPALGAGRMLAQAICTETVPNAIARMDPDRSTLKEAA